MANNEKIKAAIVIADFYRDISDGLLASCHEVLQAATVEWREVTVPGALEIPFALQSLATTDNNMVDCLIALGCVIRGETYHFEIVADNCARGIMQVQLELGIPVGNGVLTVENHTQAMARLQHGGAAARAALSQLHLARTTGNNRRRYR